MPIYGMIISDSLTFFVQLTRHLLKPSELTFPEWVFLISFVIFFIIIGYLLNRAMSNAVKGK